MTLAVGKQSNRKQGSMFKKLLVLKAAAQVDMAVSNVKYNIQHCSLGNRVNIASKRHLARK